MIEIKYKDLSSERFQSGMQKLLGQQMPVKVAYSLKRIADDVNQAIRKMREEYQSEVLSRFAVKDELGAVRWEGGLPVLDEGLAKEHKEADAIFGERVVVVDRGKLSIDSISGCQLSAAELSAIEPILFEMAIVDPGVLHAEG